LGFSVVAPEPLSPPAPPPVPAGEAPDPFRAFIFFFFFADDTSVVVLPVCAEIPAPLG
jgi:hypothetical protein